MKQHHYNLSPLTPELLEKLRAGDHDAFETVYLQSIDSMLDFLNLLLHSREQAQDLAQEIFITLWEKRANIDPNGNFKGYLYKITKTTALKRLSHRKVEEKYRSFINNLSPDFNASPDEILTSEEMAVLIKLSLANMPEKQRRVFEMSRFEGKSNDEIARELNISPNTVRVHLHNTVMKLKQLIIMAIAVFIF